MSKWVLTFALFVLVVLGFWQAVPRAQAAETITVATWNIGSKQGLSPAQRIERMRLLAGIVKERNIDVVYLQEFLSDPVDFNTLNQAFKDLQYPMYGDMVSYQFIGTQCCALAIFSKYPLDMSSRQISNGIRSNRSAQTIIARGTPIGWLRLANIHTHNTEPCNNLKSYLTFYDQFDKANTLLGGDINVYLSDKPITNGREGDDCRSVPWNDIDLSCRSGGICQGTIIDWFFVRAVSDLVIESRWLAGNLNGISDQHPLVIATVSSKSPKIDPSPVVTPPPTPPPACQNKTDITGDGKNDLYDINVLMGNYGSSVSSANKTSDINCDNRIDQTDLGLILGKMNK